MYFSPPIALIALFLVSVNVYAAPPKGPQLSTSFVEKLGRIREVQIKQQAEANDPEKPKIKITPLVNVDTFVDKIKGEDRSVALKVTLSNGFHFDLYGIFDGHGGARAAQYLVDNLPMKIAEQFPEIPESTRELSKQQLDDLKNSLTNSNARRLYENEGSTILLTLHIKDKLVLVSLGDSITAFCTLQQPRTVVLHTEEHKPNKPKELERIGKAGKKVYNEGKIYRIMGRSFSRSFGDCAAKHSFSKGADGARIMSLYDGVNGVISAEPEVDVLDISPDKVTQLIMTSDGVWDQISPAFALSFYSKGATSKDLKEAARKLRSNDDITIIALKQERYVNKKLPNTNLLIALTPKQPDHEVTSIFQKNYTMRIISIAIASCLVSSTVAGRNGRSWWSKCAESFGKECQKGMKIANAAQDFGGGMLRTDHPQNPRPAYHTNMRQVFGGSRQTDSRTMGRGSVPQTRSDDPSPSQYQAPSGQRAQNQPPLSQGTPSRYDPGTASSSGRAPVVRPGPYGGRYTRGLYERLHSHEAGYRASQARPLPVVQQPKPEPLPQTLEPANQFPPIPPLEPSGVSSTAPVAPPEVPRPLSREQEFPGQLSRPESEGSFPGGVEADSNPFLVQPQKSNTKPRDLNVYYNPFLSSDDEPEELESGVQPSALPPRDQPGSPRAQDFAPPRSGFPIDYDPQKPFLPLPDEPRPYSQRDDGKSRPTKEFYETPGPKGFDPDTPQTPQAQISPEVLSSGTAPIRPKTRGLRLARKFKRRLTSREAASLAELDVENDVDLSDEEVDKLISVYEQELGNEMVFTEEDEELLRENGSTFPAKIAISTFKPKSHILMQQRSREDRIVTSVIGTGDSQMKLWGVFDGHGGKAVVNYIEKNIASYLGNELMELSGLKATNPNLEQFKSKLSEVIQNFDRHICVDNALLVNCKSGATATIALKWKRVMFTINLGDSKTVLSFNRKFMATEDHKPGDEAEKNRIESIGGAVYFRGVPRVLGNLAVSRSFGDCEYKRQGPSANMPNTFDKSEYNPKGYVSAEPTVKAYIFPKGSIVKLIMGSDGLWDKITPIEAISNKFVESESVSDSKHDGKQKTVAELLAGKAISRNSRDDIAVIEDLIYF